MKSFWRPVWIFITAMVLMGTVSTPAGAVDSLFNNPRWQALAQQQILEATKQFYVALNAVLTGDLDPISTIWSHRPDVSDLSSSGGRDMGWNEIYERYQSIVRMQVGGKIVPQDIVVVADGEMGYSICTEAGESKTPSGNMKTYTKRATNIFRLEAGKWKLIHHHSDPVQILEQ